MLRNVGYTTTRNWNLLSSIQFFKLIRPIEDLLGIKKTNVKAFTITTFSEDGFKVIYVKQINLIIHYEYFLLNQKSMN